MDIRKGLAIASAIREAKEKAQGKNSYNIPLMAELFPATTGDNLKEQEDIRKAINSLESRKGDLSNMELAELNRLKSREQALTRNLMSLAYKENELQAQQIEHAEIIEKLKAQGVEITADELNNYI